jgi:hypothetical protein
MGTQERGFGIVALPYRSAACLVMLIFALLDVENWVILRPVTGGSQHGLGMCNDYRGG